MLVYGDRERAEDPAGMLDRLAGRLGRLADAPPGLERHAGLVAALIEAGELAQGIADLQFQARGLDEPSPDQDAALRLCLELAGAVRVSWRGGLAGSTPPRREAGETGRIRSALEALRGVLPSGPLQVRTAEGYAFYALYPEAYLEAAAGLHAPGGVGVIGVRSIGAGLGAVTADALGTRALFTVRPVGHPFRRELSPGPKLRAALGRARTWAVVDEGPGLSGSSFGAAVEALESAGVPTGRIHLFPSHYGPPGPMASPELRRRWPGLQRRVARFELLERGEGARPGLERWACDLTGEPIEPALDLSGGAWRARVFAGEADWPPVWPGQERRKYLLRTETGAWLLKFAGLGAEGERKLERARALAAAGFGPETPGLRHGFLVQRWHDEARPLQLDAPPPPGLLPLLGRYLAFRARRLPASGGDGAGLPALWEMARVNTAEAIGQDAARRLDRWKPRLETIARRLRPVEIDGRLHPWEWLRLPGGRLLKADGLDHACAHDLVGRQDIAWDLAGAGVELGLGPEEEAELARRLGPPDPEKAALMRILYLAFQLGRSAVAADGCAQWPRETARLLAARDRYAALLERALERER